MADHLLAGVLEQTQERLVDVDEPIFWQGGEAHRDGTAVERLLEPLLRFPATRLQIFPRADVSHKSDKRGRLSGNPRDREFDRELRPVFAEAREFDASAQDRPIAGLQVPGETAAVRLP